MQAIFITGGASGIGRAIAERFAREGWRVGIADVNATGLAETAALLPSGADTYRMDVREPDAWTAALDDFTAKAGRLDVLANNAGVPMGGPIAEAPFDEIERTVAINLTAAIYGARIGHAYLKRTQGSCLLNTASASAIYGSSGLATYSATKFGVRALTEALDGEWYGDGIKVRGLIPAFIDTPLLQHPSHGSNQSIRETVTAAGLELSRAEDVADAAWRAVHGDALFTYVGKTADRMRFAARWMPGRMRKMMRRGVASEK
ncbi:SDR family oxidoreductase [Sphingomonas donggukensis]|uniref:SDR family oxidoreductase n=1 Tax=Sphingomonas donggukensis TaxID=2949093 RepID=A0ABY4TUZ2_9SPHN|nr:SDR family oxidoreductase [Sphingomonas donggukensis]URW74989.1 SDR family oxidoreductase [Sphingomonas donggukensis]